MQIFSCCIYHIFCEINVALKELKKYIHCQELSSIREE